MQAGNSVTTTLIERIANEIIKVLWNHSQKLI
jgi:site-specific DNA-cytosine methylase